MFDLYLVDNKLAELQTLMKKAFNKGRIIYPRMRTAFSQLTLLWEEDSTSLRQFIAKHYLYDKVGCEQFYRMVFSQGDDLQNPPHLDIHLMDFLCKQNRSSFLTGLKQAEVYTRDLYYEKLQSFLQFHPDSHINQVSHEFEEIRARDQYWRSRLEHCDRFLKQLSLEKILVYCSLSYEEQRLASGEIDIMVARHEGDWPHIINNVINRKILLCQEEHGEVKPILKHGDDFFTLMWSTVQSAINGDQEWKEFLKLVDLYDQYDEFRHRLSRYSFEGWKIASFTEHSLNVSLSSRKQAKNEELTQLKYVLQQSFYRNYAPYLFDKEYDELEKISKTDIDAECSGLIYPHLMQYCASFLPDEICREGKVDVPVALVIRSILALESWARARYVYPMERLLADSSKKRSLELVDQVIASLFSDDEKMVGPILGRTHEEWVDAVCAVLSLDARREVSSGLEFVTADCNGNNRKYINIDEKPFIKIGELVYFMPSLLCFRNHGVRLHNLMLKYKEDRDLVREKGLASTRIYDKDQQATKVEDEVATWFKRSDFATLTEEEGKEKKLKGFRTDVLAYRQQVLFVIQIKTTYARAHLSDHFRHYQDAITKGIRQLDFDVNYIDKNWSTIRHDLGIEKDLDSTDVKVYPLLVSSTFENEGADVFVNDKYKKTSLFELDLILNNKKAWLKNISHKVVERKFGSHMPERFKLLLTGIQPDEFTQKEYDTLYKEWEESGGVERFAENVNLFKGEKTLSPIRLIEIIETGELWEI